jgi:DNA-binding NtrC family response regulator
MNDAAHVLLVAFPRLSMSLLAAMLDEAGVQTTPAADARSAGAVAGDSAIDLCIVDLDELGTRARGEVMALASQWPLATIVGLGSCETDVPVQCLVSRPFMPKELLDAVEQALAARPQAATA